MVLTDKEKWLIHFCCMTTIGKITGLPKIKEVVKAMMSQVVKERCRGLTPEDEQQLFEDVIEELTAGGNLFRYLTDEMLRQSGMGFDNDYR